MVLHETLETKASIQYQHDIDLFNLSMINNLHYVYWALHRLKLGRVLGQDWFENQSKVIDSYIIDFLSGWFNVSDTISEQTLNEIAPTRPPTYQEEQSEARNEGEDNSGNSSIVDDPNAPVSLRFKKMISLLRRRHRQKRANYDSPTSPSSPWTHRRISDSSPPDSPRSVTQRIILTFALLMRVIQPYLKTCRLSSSQHRALEEAEGCGHQRLRLQPGP